MLTGYAYLDKKKINEFAEKSPKWTDDHWQDYFYHHRNDINLKDYKKEKVKDPIESDHERAILYRLVDHLEETGQKLELYQMDDFAAVVGYNGQKYVLPSETVTASPLRDYSALPGDALKLLGADTGSMALPTVPEETAAAITGKKAEAEDQLKALDAEMMAIKDCTSSDMADLKAELDKLQAKIKIRQEELMAKLREKQEVFEKEKKKLEKELFMLETQIYGIRCYLGEVVSFYTVRSGKPAPKEMPIVVYQKIRYLDEELGKYLALYYYGDHRDDKEQLLTVLKHRDDIAELLCPGPKSISVCKISRTGKVKGASEQVINMLKDYKMFHENQLAVLVRNGDQLYISWLDADKINVSDDNVFYRPETRSEAEDDTSEGHDSFSRRFREERRVEEEKKARKEMLSRWFFFAVLQGVLDNTSLISVPEKVGVTDMNSPYIIFSLAEGRISENKYGSFSDMVAKSKDIPLREGDCVLTGTHITSGNSGRAWENDGGIGDRNRTYGASLPGMTVLPINKVIPGIKVRYTVQHCRAYIEMDPEGYVMYEYADGSASSSPKEGFEDSLVNTRRSPLYTVVRTDEVLKTECVTGSIGWRRWYGEDARSYRKLTKDRLIKLSHLGSAYIFRCDNNKDIWPGEVYIKKALYEENAPVYYKKVINAEILCEEDHAYFCHTQNTSDYTGNLYDVNLEIDLSNAIPLPFLCSTWVKSVITNGNIGEYRLCGASMSYADMLPYLHKLLAYLKEREEKEKKMLTAAGGGKWLEEDHEWDAVLCEWKIRNRIHILTETRAKRFLKGMVIPGH